MDPLTLAAMFGPQAFKLGLGLIQSQKADNLQVRDTIPAAFREQEGLARQQATAALPGLGRRVDQLDAGQNNVLQAGARAGTSSSSILGLLSSADQSRSAALADLNTRQDAYTQQQQQNLGRVLQQKGQYQLRDQQELDRNKAALREGSTRNLYGALDGASQVGAYALNPVTPGAASAATAAAPGATPTAAPGAMPGMAGYDPYADTRRRFAGYGIGGGGIY